ncbi:hypothetical protein [Salicola sp. Rm-C-2C1-2]|uniref:hypothetical protein n=1 Tax=Salicola sp. Rm-C-2C1-2 TaxID=3141321 RepID=UPI0032E38F80
MERLLLIANSALAISLLVIGICVLVAYPFADYINMAGQIAAHITMLICALGVKVSYITRLVALKELGRVLN